MPKKQSKTNLNESPKTISLVEIINFKLFKPRFSGAVAEKAREKLLVFRKIQSLNRKQKNNLLPEIRRTVIRLARFDIVRRNLELLLSILIALPFTGFASFSFFVVATYFNYSLSKMSNLTLGVGFFGVPIFFILVCYIFMILPINQFGNSIWLFLWEISLLSIFYAIFHNATIFIQNPPPLWLIFIYANALLLVLMIAFSLITDPLNRLIALAVIKTKYSRYPHLIVQERLIEILSEIEQNPNSWSNLDFKKKILKLLEEIAYCIEHHYYNRLKTGDLATDKWFENNTKEIAASFRSMKKMILSPAETSRNIFITRISKKLFQVASGNWNGLERIQPEILDKPKLWLARIGYVIRVAFISILPLLIFLGIQNSPISLEKQSFEYVVIGSILWAILNLWTSIDPFYGEKISAFQNLVQLLPGVKKKE